MPVTNNHQKTGNSPVKLKPGRKPIGDEPLTPKELSQRYRKKLKKHGGTTITVRLDGRTTEALKEHREKYGCKSLTAAAQSIIQSYFEKS